MRPANMAEAIAQLGIDGREHEGEITTRCPLHADNSPSFAINTETGLWICYAGCGKGNIRQLAAQILGLKGNELNLWTRRLGLGDAPVLRANSEQEFDLVDEDAFRKVTIEPPKEYLLDRDISLLTAVEYGIRFNPWNPAKETGKPGSDPCWMIPLRHPTEYHLIGWQSKGTTGGRQAQTTGKKGWTLFGIELVEPAQDIVLVEAPLDVAHARTYGFYNWVSTCGSSISVQQMELLADLLKAGDLSVGRTARLIVAMDNPLVDDAGAKALKKLRAAKILKGFPVMEFAYGDGIRKDPGDMDDAQIAWGLEHAA